MPVKIPPHFAVGKVIKGFGRGSKSLGIPTANFGSEVVDNLPNNFQTGVYFGWASVNNGAVHKMVMSIGWNPFFKNEKKSMETHILHTFNDDFYGDELRICILGYLRPETSFDSLDDLIAAIKKDIVDAKTALDDATYKQFQMHSFFNETNVNENI